jgi:D-alanyl-D-alanine carboxypeptidase/D-alanyl-D-alanine-endopeptidase (penicillin-binding protein 4)
MNARARAGRSCGSGRALVALVVAGAMIGGGARPAPAASAAAARKPTAAAASIGRDRGADEVPLPRDDDRDRDRIRRLQETIAEILHNRILGRLRVGLRVVSARTGRLYYARRADSLMDPASNQKVLATTAAILRLGADWRFRTELSGPEPDADGVIKGNVYLRGNGDPSLRMASLENLAARLRARGVVRVEGGVIADPRRLGDDATAVGEGENDASPTPDGRAPLIVDRGLTVVRVRPGAVPGAAAVVLTEPAQVAGDDGRHGFAIHNQALTKDGGGKRPRVTVRIDVAGGRLRIDVAGRIGVGSPGIAFRRRVPHPALHAAVLLRAALIGSGIDVRSAAAIGTRPAAAGFVETQRSAPLSVVLRKINKDSDNEQAERVLQTVGAEERGGAATTEKGLAVLREALDSLGLAPSSYLSKNGSGLGHANRITPHAMADLLRALYLDPRVGPEILQSLSVGGIDGTTRNRFKGTLAARRVRAKTGTLNGKSCLSGLVGDGDDVMVFSMMVQGFRGKSLPAVRASQVGAVTAMMRFVREGSGEQISLPAGFDEQLVGKDVETGGEVMESGQEGEGEGEGAGKDPTDGQAPELLPLSGEPPPRLRPMPSAGSGDAGLRRSRLEPPPFSKAPAGSK